MGNNNTRLLHQIYTDPENESQLAKLFANFDTDDSGLLDEEEAREVVVALMELLSKIAPEIELERALFGRISKKNHHLGDWKQLRETEEVAEPYLDQMTKIFFELLDKDGDGMISLKEWKSLDWVKLPETLHQYWAESRSKFEAFATDRRFFIVSGESQLPPELGATHVWTTPTGLDFQSGSGPLSLALSSPLSDPSVLQGEANLTGLKWRGHTLTLSVALGLYSGAIRQLKLQFQEFKFQKEDRIEMWGTWQSETDNQAQPIHWLVETLGKRPLEYLSDIPEPPANQTTQSFSEAAIVSQLLDGGVSPGFWRMLGSRIDGLRGDKRGTYAAFNPGSERNKERQRAMCRRLINLFGQAGVELGSIVSMYVPLMEEDAKTSQVKEKNFSNLAAHKRLDRQRL